MASFGIALDLFPVAEWNGFPFVPSQGLRGNRAFQTLVVTFASYLRGFWLLRKCPASRLAVFSFRPPLFGEGRFEAGGATFYGWNSTRWGPAVSTPQPTGH